MTTIRKCGPQNDPKRVHQTHIQQVLSRTIVMLTSMIMRTTTLAVVKYQEKSEFNNTNNRHPDVYHQFQTRWCWCPHLHMWTLIILNNNQTNNNSNHHIQLNSSTTILSNNSMHKKDRVTWILKRTCTKQKCVVNLQDTVDASMETNANLLMETRTFNKVQKSTIPSETRKCVSYIWMAIAGLVTDVTIYMPPNPTRWRLLDWLAETMLKN